MNFSWFKKKERVYTEEEVAKLVKGAISATVDGLSDFIGNETVAIDAQGNEVPGGGIKLVENHTDVLEYLRKELGKKGISITYTDDLSTKIFKDQQN